MKRSTERILTTHTGSLPRPPDLAEMMFDREEGRPVDEAKLQQRIREAVIEVVKKQAECGVDVVSDGEMSKVGYSTYVKDRLTGFGGQGQLVGIPEMQEFSEFFQRLWTDPALAHLKTPVCCGPIEPRNTNAVQRDIDNLKAALESVQVKDAFMTAASPGVIAVFLVNEYYPSYESYLQALVDAMRPEYEAIVNAGFVLQLDCPDLAMSRHMGENASMTTEQFRSKIALNVEAINDATRNIPPDRLRMHLCWGNYEGPHLSDIPLRDIIDIVFQARPSAILVEAANPRHEHEWAIFETVKLPEGKILIPGVIDSTNNYVEHPELIAQRIVRYAKLVGRENVMAGTDCGFGTFVGMSTVDPKITWKKFEALAEGARLATEQLWQRTLV
jgi:5-methyltetrahydropteroyltriglutamate--homocysteine methyltransferase